ncbi:MAG: AsmA family protein [Magnetospirillum sp.]|nr:AsmA family protein [Magnetospirillum sp.]
MEPPPPQPPLRPVAASPLPRDLFASLDLAVDALSWRGQVVRQAKVEAVLDQGEVLLRQASAQLPGATDASAEGSLTNEAGRAVFDGQLRLKSVNGSALAGWLGLPLPEDRARAVELATPVRLAWPEMRLDDFRLTVDGTQARGSAAARFDATPTLAVSATLEGMEAMVKGRLAEDGRVADGAFRLSSRQGLKPLAAFGLKPPAVLERLGGLVVEGTASGTTDALALDARAESGGVTLSAKGNVVRMAHADMAVQARAASLSQVLRLLGDSRAQGGGAFTLDARVTGDSNVVEVSGLTLRAGASSLGGQGRVDLKGAKPAITAELAADTLALDSLLGSERTGRLLPGGPLLPPTLAPRAMPTVPAAAVGAGASPFSREPLDLSALNAFDARIGLTTQTVTAKDWRLENATSRIAVQGGTATVERLTGKLLGGDLSLNGKLSAGTTPALSGEFTVAGADLGAARLEGAGMTVTRGRMDAQGHFATSGRSSQDMAARLNGEGRLLVRDGTLDGFDLPAVNRQLGNLQNIGSLLGVVQAGLAGGQTPFSQLAGTWRADNGIVTSRDLKLEAEGGGASADMQVNLPDWTTRSTIAFHLANAPQTPLTARLEGPLENPRKIIDINAIQQYLVSRGLGRALKGKDGNNLLGTLGGQQEQQQQQQSSEQPQSEQPREKNTGKNILKNLLKGLGGQ